MKIAIVAPSPIPFMVGGAEKLWQGFYRYLCEQTSHEVDLIKVPTKEHTLIDLVESYARFSQLDLSGFDVVISTKYPAWAINHPRHVVYLQHRLRGFYDSYPASLPTEYAGSHPGARGLMEFMTRNAGITSSFGEFTEHFFYLAEHAAPNADYLAFPGPVARAVVRYLDGITLHPDRIERYASISDEVRKRADYFPLGVAVDVIHHPTSLAVTPNASKHPDKPYLFLAGRLDGPKRHALLIDAFKNVRGDIRLKIAGTGPIGDELKARAASDPRIEFLGFISDVELAEYYRGSLAVPFFPELEDYGLITLEAMLAGKPVITTTDAGGTNELVKNDETGFIVKPDLNAITSAMQALVDDPAKAERMGAEGYKQAQEITWERLLTRLIPEAAPTAQVARKYATQVRKRVVVATSYPIYPPRGGGQSRLFHLFRGIAKHCDVEIVSLDEVHHPHFIAEIAPGLIERRMPITWEHYGRENDIRKEAEFLHISDVALPKLHVHTPHFVNTLRKAMAQADIAIAGQPYTFAAIEAAIKANGGKHAPMLGLETQNVEYLLKQHMLPSDNAAALALVEETRVNEGHGIEKSSFVLACSQDDKQGLQRIYNVPEEKFVWAPNGVDTHDVAYVGPNERKQRKAKAGLSQTVALFIGSWHAPNLDAVAIIEAMAPKFPDVVFLIAGGVGMAPRKHSPPSNMRFLGKVDDEQRLALLALADVALNPMLVGSGTNLKMLDYLAAGIPVVSTEVGARGLDLISGTHYAPASGEDFAVGLQEMLKHIKTGDWAANCKSGRKHVEANFDWGVIAEHVIEHWKRLGVI
jgi:glycosyltransferase involved in cell wall biosynthesis